MTDGLQILNARYVSSAVRPDQYPVEDRPEIAFLGRSNVGKSSLINSLCRHRGLALVSGRPGKTQTINFFAVNAKIAEVERLEWFLVDLPGYGYAQRAKESRRQWSAFIDTYITKAPRLQLVCQLIDIRHSPMGSDRAAYNWLAGGSRVPVQIVATKADKLSRSEIRQQTELIRRELGCEGRVIPYSAVTGQGRDELLDVIGTILLQLQSRD
mgnify:FL=1